MDGITPDSLSDPAEEVDVWYGSYDGRAIVPRVIQLILLSILIVALAWYLGAWRGQGAVRYAAMSLLGLLWVYHIIRWVYHVTALNYRLTTKRLFCERGFRHPGKPGAELKSIAQVVVEAGRMERWLDVGRIRLFVHGHDSPLVLEGVRHPFHVAKQIQRRIGD
jgi:hypothetical protein